MKLAGGVVHGQPYGLGHIALLRSQSRSCKLCEDRSCEVGVGFRNEVLDANLGILRELRRRSVARYDQLRMNVEMRKLVSQRTGEAINGLLARDIGCRQRERRQSCARCDVN